MRYFFLLMSLTGLLFSTHSFCASLTETYVYNPKIAPNVWNALTEFFLPEDHPVKPALDILLAPSQYRTFKNSRTLTKEGFTIIQMGRSNHVFVVSHPQLKGYLLKLFTERQSNKKEWEMFKNRIKGAQIIQNLLDQYALNHLFKVPKKWIYPLPVHPCWNRKFVLVVENVHPFNAKDNAKLWKSSCITKELLEGLYLILKKAGLQDSTYLVNIPFSTDDHKITFLDTEDHTHWPVPYSRLEVYLAPPLKEYWISLTK